MACRPQKLINFFLNRITAGRQPQKHKRLNGNTTTEIRILSHVEQNANKSHINEMQTERALT